MKRYRHATGGFTLVELVMVIVLLGILAATALPKFADLGSDARQSVFEAVRGNFKTGVRVVHSKSLLHKNAGVFPDVSLEGVCIKVDPNSGYPVVDQNTGTCSAVADRGGRTSLIRKLYASLFDLLRGDASLAELQARIPGISTAMAVAPPPPPPPPAADSLPARLMNGDFTGWTWTENPPLGTLTSPENRSFTYSQNTGEVN